MGKLIVANWKMNPVSLKEAEVIFNGISILAKDNKNTDIVVCPPFPFLSIFPKTKIKNFSLGAQNTFYEPSGAYTGQVSSKMLANLGVKYVIVGHSESRLQGDTNEIINKKILASLKEKMFPILCIGENIRDSHGEYLSFVKKQIEECLFSVSKTQIKNIIIAYEPIWAIGEKAIREASVEEFVEMRIFIKRIIVDIYGIKIANEINIIYGGSVHKENARAFIVDGEAGGLLVGRDSLIPKKFGAILNAIK
jgi:triosephosphate isomerase